MSSLNFGASRFDNREVPMSPYEQEQRRLQEQGRWNTEVEGAPKAFSTDALLDERQKTHGSFARNSYYGQTLRDLFRNSDGWQVASPRTREALDLIACKLSRILSGQPNEKQHWEDIAGYAELVYSDKQR